MCVENQLIAGIQDYLLTYPFGSIEEVITETCKGFEQVSLDSSGRLHCHLAAILKHRNRELGTWHAGEPDAKISMDHIWVNLFYESF